MICEIRIPCYKRPELLVRALESLALQTEREWVAYVFDDSPEQCNRSVVDAFGDSRVRYRWNQSRLGAAGNIDQAFQKAPICERLNVQYGCILEEDNLFGETHLADCISSLRKSKLKLLLKNQAVISDADKQPVGSTTLGAIYSTGVFQPQDAWLRTFYSGGVSNGAFFWDFTKKTDLQIGKVTSNSIIQEYLRALAIQEPFGVDLRATAFWTRNESDSVNYSKNWLVRKRSKIAKLKAVQQIRLEAWRRVAIHTDDVHGEIPSGKHNCFRKGLLNCGIFQPRFGNRFNIRNTALFLRGRLMRHLYPSQFSQFSLTEI